MNRIVRAIGLLICGAVAVGICLLFIDHSEVLKELGNPSGFEEALNEQLPCRDSVLSIWQKWLSVTNRRFFADSDLFLDGEGQFLKGSESQSLDFAFRNVMKLKKYCDITGRKFLYVILPGKPFSDNELQELGISCERNTVADSMFDVLSEKEIPCFDARSLFTEEDFYSYFFRTDHHWTPDAGLLTARALLSQLNRRFGYTFKTEVLDSSKFSREVFSNKWVGEYGEKALGRYAQKDDFIVLKPTFEVHLRYQDKNLAGESKWEEGDFSILLDETRLDEQGHKEKQLYYYYLPNAGIMEIENKDVNEGNILILKDSFSNVMLPYLSLAVNHVTAWDMRENKAVYRYLEEHPEIETVLVAYTISFVPTTGMNDFQQG